MLTDYVRNGFEEQHYTVFNLFDDFIEIINKRKGAEIGKSTHSKYLLAIEQFKIVVGNKPLRAVDNTDILNYKYHLKNELKLKEVIILYRAYITITTHNVKTCPTKNLLDRLSLVINSSKN